MGLSLGVGLWACSGDDEDGGDGGSGGSGSGTVKVICQVEDMGEVIGCDEHDIPEPAVDVARDACTSDGGILVDRCPTAGFIGKCSTVMGALIIHHYAAAGEDAAEAEQTCTLLGGTWIPP